MVERELQPWWVRIGAGWGAGVLVALVMVLTTALGAWLYTQRLAQLESVTAIVANQARAHLQSWIDTRLGVMRLLVMRWPERYAEDPEAFRRDAELLLQRLPGMLALNWVDADGVIRLVTPEDGNRAALGADLYQHSSADVGRALAEADRSGRPTRTGALELLQGGRGFAFYWPVVDGSGATLGFVNGVVRARELAAAARLEDELASDFRVELADSDGALLWRSADGSDWRFAATRRLDMPGGPDLHLVVAPTPEAIADETGVAQIAGLLLISYLVAGLLGLVTFFRAREHAALQRSERTLREVMDLLPHPVYVKDDQGRFSFVNRALADLSGRTAADLIGHGSDVLPGDREENQRHDVADREALAAAEPLPVRRESFASGQGQQRVLDVVRVPFVDPANQRSSVLGIGVDVTERLASEAFGARVAGALEHAGEAITVLDAQGRVVFANPAFVDMMGYTGRSVVGLPMSAFAVAGSEDKSLLREIAGKLARGEIWKQRYASLWEDGVERVRDATVAPVRDDAGNAIGFIGVIRDVTREQQLEQELRQSQKLEAVGQLAGGIAHDFNNLLTVILGYASQLQEHARAGTPEGDAAVEIERAAERAADLTERLLTFSRRGTRRAAVAHMNDVVRSLAPMLTRLIGEQITVQLDLDPRVAEVAAATSEIEQIVVNLCVNARDAMPRGGRLRLWTLQREAGSASSLVRPNLPDGEYVVIGVTDNGVGMSYEVQQRIFDPFFTTKDIGAGTGLGLSTVYGIAEQRGGGVFVDSAPGKGATVAVWLPVAQPDEDGEPAAGGDTEDRVHVGARVLVVEDEQSIREMVAEALERAGYTVTVAADGEQALTLAETAGDIDLLVSDVVMPRMNGPELRDRLLQRHPDLRVLFVTGYAPQIGGAAPRSTDRVLQKPFRLGELLAAVADLLDGRARRPGG